MLVSGGGGGGGHITQLSVKFVHVVIVQSASEPGPQQIVPPPFILDIAPSFRFEITS